MAVQAVKLLQPQPASVVIVILHTQIRQQSASLPLQFFNHQGPKHSQQYIAANV